jgi:hypothetical protein
MAIDYSLSAFPKSRVKALDKQDKAKALEALDKKESAKARKRAKGRCEVQDVVTFRDSDGALIMLETRCGRKDTETPHLSGGSGRRNKGKLRVCKECHQAITQNILRPTTATHDAATVRYWRSR